MTAAGPFFIDFLAFTTFKIIHPVPGMTFSGGRRQGSVPPGLISKPSQLSSQSARGQNMSRNNVF